MILDGRDVSDYIKERHVRDVRALLASELATPPVLAIVRQGATPATDVYLRVKKNYGEDIGVDVRCYTESASTIIERLQGLADDQSVTAISVELPFEDDPRLTDQALASVPVTKDVEGLAPNTSFELPTPKGIRWLIAAFNRPIAGPIVVVGQGRLVGSPLSDEWERQGHEVHRCDIETPEAELEQKVRSARLLVSATGVPGLIKNDWITSGATIIDAGTGHIDGKVAGDLEHKLHTRSDIAVTPNPGGVGPMTVAALFDNVLIAAQSKR